MLRAFSASICCCACATVAPGLSRPTIDQLLLCRESSDRLLGREGQRQPQLDLGIDEEEVGRQDADDRVRLAVDPQVAADGVVAGRRRAAARARSSGSTCDRPVSPSSSVKMRPRSGWTPSIRSSEAGRRMPVTRCGSPSLPIVTPRVL